MHIRDSAEPSTAAAPPTGAVQSFPSASPSPSLGSSQSPSARAPWRWLPSLYFCQGLPYVVVMQLAVVMYKNLGVSNTDMALYTSWLYLPWVIKPLWSPLVELLGRKRVWIVAMQLFVGVALAAVALALPGPRFLAHSLALLWLMAFASATHDIAADGFYMLALPEPSQQAAYVGVRSLFYRLAMLAGQGSLVWLVGWWHQRSGSFVEAWALVMGALAGLFVLAALLHALTLPKPASDVVPDQRQSVGELTQASLTVFARFFSRPDWLGVLGFLLLYRLAEAQLLKMVVPFLLDPVANGGLGLTNQQQGIAYGSVGMAALMAGALLGGWFISKRGLAASLWPLVLAMHVPGLLFVWLALALPESFVIVCAALALEQFGYGFGFTAYMVFMLRVASGTSLGPEATGKAKENAASADLTNPHKTAHYSLCTGFMALGMMVPGFWAGWLQERVGYASFFALCLLTALPSLWMVAWVHKKLAPAP